jgi:hypothetical protein
LTLGIFDFSTFGLLASSSSVANKFCAFILFPCATMIYSSIHPRATFVPHLPWLQTFHPFRVKPRAQSKFL